MHFSHFETAGGDTAIFTYNGDGNRVKKWVKQQPENTPPADYISRGDQQITGLVTPVPVPIVSERYYIYDESGQVIWEDDDTPNIVANPGFEQGLDNWYLWGLGGASTNWELTSDHARGGLYSVKAGAYDDAAFEQVVQNFNQPQLTVPYTLSAYVKTESVTGTGARVAFEFWTAGFGDCVGGLGSETLTGTNGWTLLTLTAYPEDIPEGTGAIKINLRRYEGEGTVWFDCVRLESGAEPSPEVKYIYANGKHVAKIVDETIFYYHLDPLGSPVVITDANGDEVKRYDYYAFGDLRSESGDLPNTHKFTGKELDETELYYYGARYYDKSVGRFIRPDPSPLNPKDLNLKDPQALNVYLYCMNNPLNYIDIDGKFRVTHRRYAWATTPGWIAREELSGLVPGLGLAYTAYRHGTGDMTVTWKDWALHGVTTGAAVASWTVKSAILTGKLALAARTFVGFSNLAGRTSALVKLGCAEAYRDKALWAIAKREGIVEGITDRVDLLSEKGKDFLDIVDFLRHLEKHDWDFEKMKEAGLFEQHEQWTVYRQEFLEEKEEIDTW